MKYLLYPDENVKERTQFGSVLRQMIGDENQPNACHSTCTAEAKPAELPPLELLTQKEMIMEIEIGLI